MIPANHMFYPIMTVNFSSSSAFYCDWGTNLNGNQSMWRELGFASQSNYPSVASTVFNSPQCIQLDFPINFIIYIKELGVGVVSSYGCSGSFSGTYDVTSGSIQHYRAQSGNIQKVKLISNQNRISTLTVTLYYDNGNPLSLNGCDWSMLLECKDDC